MKRGKANVLILSIGATLLQRKSAEKSQKNKRTDQEQTKSQWKTRRASLWWRRRWERHRRRTRRRSRGLSWATQSVASRKSLAYWSCSRSSSAEPSLFPSLSFLAMPNSKNDGGGKRKKESCNKKSPEGQWERARTQETLNSFSPMSLKRVSEREKEGERVEAHERERRRCTDIDRLFNWYLSIYVASGVIITTKEALFSSFPFLFPPRFTCARSSRQFGERKSARLRGGGREGSQGRNSD